MGMKGFERYSMVVGSPSTNKFEGANVTYKSNLSELLFTKPFSQIS